MNASVVGPHLRFQRHSATKDAAAKLLPDGIGDLRDVVQTAINDEQADTPEKNRTLHVIASYFRKTLKVTKEETDGKLVLYRLSN